MTVKTFLILFVGVAFGLFLFNLYLKIAYATDACPNEKDGWVKIDSDNLSAYPVQGATKYCFKFGSENSNGCIGGISDVWPPQVDGKYCGLSHWSYFMGARVTVTPTDFDNSPTPTAGESATPTVTPTATESPTPTQGVSEQQWNNTRAVEGNTYGPAK